MTDRITSKEIRELRKLEQRATPGPWEDEPSLARVWSTIYRDTRPIAFCERTVLDAIFIAAARNALPRLLDEIERLRHELEWLRYERDQYDARRREAQEKELGYEEVTR